MTSHFFSHRLASVFALSLIVAVTPTNAEDIPNPQASPTAVARASFDSLKRKDMQAFVSLFHPAEIKRFKAFALDVFKYEKPDEEILQIRKLFAPCDSAGSVASTSGSDLMASFLKNTFAAVPGFDDIIGGSKLQILGEIVEKEDKVHVITRTVLPRPSPVSCQRSDGRWYQLLNDEAMRTITAFERKEHFRKKGLPIERLSKSMSMKTIDVVGHVNDGEDLAQVLCRVTMKLDDYTFPVFGCYPVRRSEPAWNHLNDEDKTMLVDALRSKWTR